MLRDEAVAERAVRGVDEDPRLAPPALSVPGVERVDVDVPPVPVARVADAVGAEAVHRLAEIREPSEDTLELAAIGPVGVELELWQLTGPVRDVRLDVELVLPPRIEAEQR